MAAKDVIHGQAGTTGAALLKLLPFCLMILPGVAARVIIDITGKHLSDIMKQQSANIILFFRGNAQL